MTTYPAIAWFARHGRRLAYLTAIPGALVAACIYWLTGSGLGTLLACMAAVLTMFAVRLAAEVIEVLTETLIPR